MHTISQKNKKYETDTRKSKEKNTHTHNKTGAKVPFAYNQPYFLPSQGQIPNKNSTTQPPNTIPNQQKMDESG